MPNEFIRRRKGGIHFGRYGEILRVLVKYGFGDILSHLNIEKYKPLRGILPSTRKGAGIARKISRWERVRLALEELGPTFIKLGQFMSNRPDVLPAALISELVKLQDSVKPYSTQEAKKIVEEELKVPLSDIVSEFEQIPMASASIAQVHGARLKGGQEVVFKIQRPRIRQTIATDIDILFHLANLAQHYYENARAFRVSQLVEEFERIIHKELDFTIEARHMEAFQRNFSGDENVYLPRVYRDFTTRRVLVTEHVHGIKVSEIEKLKENNFDTKDIARRGANIVLQQIFNHGFFHADPHPGNILIKHDGAICMLDCGAVGIIPSSLRYHIGVILYAVVSKESERIVRTLMRLSHNPIVNPQQLEYDIDEFIQEYSSLMLKDINVGEVLQRFGRVIINHNLEIIPGFYLLLKSMVTIEGVGRMLDEEFTMVEYVQPYVHKLTREGPRFKHIPYDIYFTALDTVSLVRDLPFEIKDLLRIFKGGRTRIQFEHRGLEPYIEKLDQSVNRIAFAIVLAALIVGSSIVIHAGIPPKIFDIPLIGIVGFALAGFIGFGLLFSIIRYKKM